jgi:hypothetical protein
MGRYASYEEVIIRYPVLKTWGKNQGEIEADLITNAEAELDARLAQTFTVPFSAGHQTIKDITIDLCYLKMLRTRDAEKYAEVNSSIMGFIQDLIDGKAFIITASGYIQAGDTSGEVWSNTEDYHPTFSMLDAESVYSHIDSSMLAADEAERS